MVQKKRYKHLYRTTDELFDKIRIFKIEKRYKNNDDTIDELIRLGLQKSKELDKERESIVNKEVLSFGV